MANGPGIYNFPAMVRGDTFRARNLASNVSQDSVPLALTSARMQVRALLSGDVLLEWASCEITGDDSNTVRLSAKTSDEMQVLPIGAHLYDLEVIFASDGAKLTLLAGKFPITEDITRD